MNVRRYQKWAKSGLAIMLAGAMMVGTAASGGGMTAQAAETEIPKVPTAPTADLPAAEEPAEENTDHHLWQWY